MKLDAIRKKIYKELKSKSANFDGQDNEELSNYLKDQKKFSKRKFKASSEKSLQASILKANIVYLGDFHCFDQSSKNLFRMVKKFFKQRKKIVIGVEFIDSKFQPILNAFLNSEISELEFLEQINYSESWHFPWSHYKEFFFYAREHQISILALNSQGSLKERDIFASEIIAKYSNSFNILVFFGELHILPNKIPQLVANKTKNLKQLIIHQNLDHVYWSLKNKDDVNIIKFNNTEYSIQSSPPWIKYESFLYWRESFYDDPDFDVNEYIFNNGLFDLSSSSLNYFKNIFELVVEHLDLNQVFILEENFNLYDHTKLEYITSIKSTKKIEHFVEKLLIHGFIFHYPDQNIYYCPSYSFNRISSIVGFYIFNLKNQYLNIVFTSLKKEEKFTYFVLQSCFSFITSKLINPQIKCDLYKDIKNQKIRSLLDINCFSEVKNSIAKDSLFDLYLISQKIGQVIGHYLYDGIYLKNNTTSIDLLNHIIECDYSELHYFYLVRSCLDNYTYQEDQKRIF